MLKPPVVSDEKPALLKLPPMATALSAGTPIGFRPENDSNSISFASTAFRTSHLRLQQRRLGGDGHFLGERAGLECEVEGE